jgi:hypothetical protein
MILVHPFLLLKNKLNQNDIITCIKRPTSNELTHTEVIPKRPLECTIIILRIKVMTCSTIVKRNIYMKKI